MKLRIINEAFVPMQKLYSQLNKDMIDAMTQASGTNDCTKWKVIDDWKKALNNADNMAQANSLIEIYLQNAIAHWHWSPTLIEDGKEIVIKLFYELGFTPNVNPYINFLNVITSLNLGNQMKLTEDDWVKLNDWYANRFLDFNDLTGRGENKQEHIIFNPYLYKSEYSDEYVDYYDKLDNSKLKQFSLSRIVDDTSLPYHNLKSLPDYRTNTSWDATNGKKIRDIIFYKDFQNPKGELQPIESIKQAYNLGTNTNTAGQRNNSSDDDDIRDLIQSLDRNQLNDVIRYIRQRVNQ